MTPPPPRSGPLVGLKVLEIGHYIAAPFCTRILADLGAEVIKLLVMSTNGPAVKLYANNGFQVDYVTSRWWKLVSRGNP